jgi:hypothetical protein
LPQLFGTRQVEAEKVAALVWHVDILTVVGTLRKRQFTGGPSTI